MGYQEAAALGAWRMLPEGDGFRFTARVVSEHPYWITQEPLDLSISVGRTEWLWRGVSVRRSGEDCVIHLVERPIIEGRPKVAGS